ncbi:hypothetical protein, partial [Salmonella sp. SAL4438]|uniref:hypothetical protein n=1 Tax=Salmonella sp. SAL4438 TaxID=3159893 RepID=UPI00397AE337
TLSYAPNSGDQNQIGDASDGPRHNVSAYGTYSYEGDGWSVTAGAGASVEGLAEQTPGQGRDEQDFYQAGVTVNLGNFGIGGAFEYYS